MDKKSAESRKTRIGNKQRKTSTHCTKSLLRALIISRMIKTLLRLKTKAQINRAIISLLWLFIHNSPNDWKRCKRRTSSFSLYALDKVAYINFLELMKRHLDGNCNLVSQNFFIFWKVGAISNSAKSKYLNNLHSPSALFGTFVCKVQNQVRLSNLTLPSL